MFLSYLPEAGQYSSFFLYLRQVCSGYLVAFEQKEKASIGICLKIFGGKECREKKKCVNLLQVINEGADVR